MVLAVTADPNFTAWLGFLGTVIVGLLGLIGVLANRTRQHARAARVQVENSHTTNFREEGDDRHLELMTALNHHGDLLSQHGDLLVVQSKAIERLTAADIKAAARIDTALEAVAELQT